MYARKKDLETTTYPPTEQHVHKLSQVINFLGNAYKVNHRLYVRHKLFSFQFNIIKIRHNKLAA